ncbi:MAG TPA: hypothetical protein VK951_01545 [Miltoncostaeaceae bacterium]|nr:hypothetical protein [Miltoncostaeaceae bacterium]
MPLAQFTEAVLIGSSLVTTGTTRIDPTGVVEDVVTHYAVVQGEAMVRGTVGITSSDWSDTQPVGAVTAGPAFATGVTIVYRSGLRPAFETFTWSQEIKVRAG